MNCKLIKPTIEYKEQYLDMIKEWKESKEEFVPFVLGYDSDDFEAMLDRLEKDTNEEYLKEGYVPCSTYWLVGEDGKVLGASNIRHRLGERNKLTGGHIGYGIRPSERRKGYAKEMLSQALKILSSIGVEKALVTCDEDNIASEKTIVGNGGVLESVVEHEEYRVKRFWIDII